MHISPTEAIKLYDVSKPTLYSDMKEGKLSFKIDDRKKRKIDIAELERLYKLRDDHVSQSTLNNVKVRKENTEFNVNNESVEFVKLQEK